jgi:hypothetical protein
MSAKAQWLRLSVNWSESEWLDALDWPVRAVWPEFLARVKSMGRAGTMAKMPVHRFAGLTGIPLEYLQAFIDAAVKCGAVIDDGESWTVVKWSDYQLDDATAVIRKRNQREREKLARHAVTPVTNCDNKECHDDNGVYPSRVTTIPLDHLTSNKYKQEESTILLPKGNEKPLAMPVLDEEPTRTIVHHLCEVARFKKRFCDLSHSESEIRAIGEIVKGWKGAKSELQDLAQECSSFYLTNKKHTSPSAVFRTWVRNHVTNFGRTAPPPRNPLHDASKTPAKKLEIEKPFAPIPKPEKPKAEEVQANNREMLNEQIRKLAEGKTA